MSKELVISTSPHETRVAILENGHLCEIYVEREKEYAAGPNADLPEVALKGLAALEPPDADPATVAEAIVNCGWDGRDDFIRTFSRRRFYAAAGFGLDPFENFAPRLEKSGTRRLLSRIVPPLVPR